MLFPWLEGTIRYTDVRTRKYSSDEDFSGDQSYKDKSFDFKVRLWEEDYSLPQVALGKRDIAGTGLFDGEYLVASKMAGPVDFTFGIAWGYPGNSDNVGNPLCHDNNKYCTRGERMMPEISALAICFVVRRLCLAASSIRRPGSPCA